MAKHDRKRKRERRDEDRPARESTERTEAERAEHPNPPFTKRGGMVAPKFGSAGSGGAEYEPGPERD